MNLSQTLKSFVPGQVKKKARKVLEAVGLMEPRPYSSEEILTTAYKRIGILNYETDAVSGEHFLLEQILPLLLKNPEPVLFDVGANIGKFTTKLAEVLPSAIIHAFEPSSATRSKLMNNVRHERVRFVAKGLSDSIGEASFFDYGENPASTHASLYSEVFTVLRTTENVASFKVDLTTVDAYCESEKLTRIDFIKIDTEGNELAVLRGARRLIERGGLPVIQFEFNEMNIFSKAFLKDFYQTLENYQFFRLMPKGLLPLGPYNSRNEIFIFQNILAVRTDAHSEAVIKSFLVTPLSKPPR